MRGFLFLTLLAACDKEDKGGSGEVEETGTPPDDTGTPPDDTDEPPPCTAAVASTDPLDGAVDVALDAVPSVVLTEADATAWLESDIPGTYTVSTDGLTLTWTADGELEADTLYTVTANTCTGSQSFSFTTVAPTSPDHLVDRAWEFNLSDGTITEPAALEALLGDQLVPGLLGVWGAGPGTIDLRIAATDTEDTSSTHQDYCLASSEIEDATYDDGAVRGMSAEFWVTLIEGDPVPIYNLDFSGVWTEDGSRFENGTLQGQMDARYVADWIGFTPDELCDFAVLLGITCEACPDDEAYCLSIRVEDLNGDEVDTTVIGVADSDCPGCDAGEPVCE